MLTLCSNVFVIYFEAIHHFHKENSIQIFTRVLNTHLVLCESPGRNVKPRHISPNFKCHISPNFMIKKFHEVQQSPLVSDAFTTCERLIYFKMLFLFWFRSSQIWQNYQLLLWKRWTVLVLTIWEIQINISFESLTDVPITF